MNKDNFSAWQYNVADHLKNKTVEEIKQHLNDTSLPFAVAVEHLLGDFNMSTVIRNANGFGAREVFYIGKKKWDRRGAVGTHNYTPVKFLDSQEELAKLSKSYTIVGVDNVPGAISIENYNWNTPSLLVFGEEGPGLTKETQNLCKDIVYIPMFGSVRSFNCGVASGIAMFDFVKKYKENNK